PGGISDRASTIDSVPAAAFSSAAPHAPFLPLSCGAANMLDIVQVVHFRRGQILQSLGSACERRAGGTMSAAGEATMMRNWLRGAVAGAALLAGTSVA